MYTSKGYRLVPRLVGLVGFHKPSLFTFYSVLADLSRGAVLLITRYSYRYTLIIDYVNDYVKIIRQAVKPSSGYCDR
jgi:hypothetical protein